MLRLPRRLATILLWIGIALLPLRGAATVVMPALMLGSGPAAATAQVPEQVQAEMPCHASAAAVVDAAGTANHSCSLCDLCHSAAAQAPQPPALPAQLPDSLPQADISAALEPRAPDGLFRPPRHRPA